MKGFSLLNPWRFQYFCRVVKIYDGELNTRCAGKYTAGDIIVQY